jgi:hypothetical protein
MKPVGNCFRSTDDAEPSLPGATLVPYCTVKPVGVGKLGDVLLDRTPPELPEPVYLRVRLFARARAFRARDRLTCLARQRHNFGHKSPTGSDIGAPRGRRSNSDSGWRTSLEPPTNASIAGGTEKRAKAGQKSQEVQMVEMVNFWPQVLQLQLPNSRQSAPISKRVRGVK